MAFNKARFQSKKQQYQNDIDNGRKKPYDCMQEYKAAIKLEDYETAKAITVVLEPLNYHTSDTHRHIPELNS